MEWLLWIAGVVLFILLLMISVGLHEAGHMVAAKKLGVKVPEFFVGFGTKIFSFKRGETEYGLRTIPAGGYVRLVDESIEEGKPEREMLSNVAPWKRQIIFFAGPFVNLVLGFILIFGVLASFPYEQPSTTLKTVNTCTAEEVSCGALAAGMAPGDKVTAIDGTPVKLSTELTPLIKGKKTVDITAVRNGETINFEDVAIKDDRFGVYLTWEEAYRTPVEALEQTGLLVQKSAEAIISIPQQIPGLAATVFQGAERDPESVGSVVGAGKTYGDVAATDKLDVEGKARTLLLIAGGLNLSLAAVNLLPIGALDGFKMLTAFIDSIRIRIAKIRRKEYSPVPYNVVKWATIIPSFGLVALMALLIVADIVAPITVL